MEQGDGVSVEQGDGVGVEQGDGVGVPLFVPKSGTPTPSPCSTPTPSPCSTTAPSLLYQKRHNVYNVFGVTVAMIGNPHALPVSGDY